MGGIVTALWQWWSVQAYLVEAYHWLDAVLARHGGLSPLVLADVLTAKSNLLVDQGYMAHAQTCLEENLVLRQQLGDPRRLAYALIDLAGVVVGQGEHDRRLTLLEAGLESFRVRNDIGGIADALCVLGMLHVFCTGDLDSARGVLAEGLGYNEIVGNQRGIMVTAGLLGTCYYLQGKLRQAMPLLKRSQALAQQLHDRINCMCVLLIFGTIAIDMDQMVQGVQLIEAAGAERVRLNMEGFPLFDIPPKLAAAQSCLGEAAYAAA